MTTSAFLAVCVEESAVDLVQVSGITRGDGVFLDTRKLRITS